MTMDEVIKKLQSLSTKEEREEFLSHLSDKQRKTKVFEEMPEKFSDEVPTLSFNKDRASIVWSTGLTVNFSKSGNIEWYWNSSKLNDKEVENLESSKNIPHNFLHMCFNHIVQLHIKEKQEIHERLLSKDYESEGKTRYVHTSNKKAFVAGMIMGRKMET